MMGRTQYTLLKLVPYFEFVSRGSLYHEPLGKVQGHFVIFNATCTNNAIFMAKSYYTHFEPSWSLLEWATILNEVDYAPLLINAFDPRSTGLCCLTCSSIFCTVERIKIHINYFIFSVMSDIWMYSLGITVDKVSYCIQHSYSLQFKSRLIFSMKAMQDQEIKTTVNITMSRMVIKNGELKLYGKMD